MTFKGVCEMWRRAENKAELLRLENDALRKENDALRAELESVREEAKEWRYEFLIEEER